MKSTILLLFIVIVKFHSKVFDSCFSADCTVVQKCTTAVQSFNFFYSNLFVSRLAIQYYPFKNFLQLFSCSKGICFGWLVDLFLNRSLSMHSAIRIDTIGNIFVSEVTCILQGLYGSWNFILAFSRTGKSWKKTAGPGKCWKSVKIK